MSLQSFVPTPELEEYRETFKEHYKMERSEDGVLIVRAHCKDGPIQLSVEHHRSYGQMLKTVGADPKNEVLIITGTGETFLANIDPHGFQLEHDDMAYWAYEYGYKDGRINASALINDVEIPTIGVINGPTAHAEMLLMCDITICTDDTYIYDRHFCGLRTVPGDGIHSCFQELLGVKRAAYALMTLEFIDAQKALELGMVNEVLPRDKIMDRAKEIADSIMKQPRTVRRLTTQVIRRPWKKRIVDDLDGGFGIQMFGHLAKGVVIHDDSTVDDSVMPFDRKKGIK